VCTINLVIKNIFAAIVSFQSSFVNENAPVHLGCWGRTLGDLGQSRILGWRLGVGQVVVLEATPLAVEDGGAVLHLALTAVDGGPCRAERRLPDDGVGTDDALGAGIHGGHKRSSSSG